MLLKVLIILLLPTPAFAFSSATMLDPDFMSFAFIKAPVTASFAMAFWESVYFSLILKPLKIDDLKFGNLFTRLLAANLFTMIFNVLVVVLLIFVLTETLLDTIPEIAWGGALYFAIVFAYVGWIAKRKILNEKVKEKLEEKILKKLTFWSNAVSYSFFYIFLYFSLF